MDKKQVAAGIIEQNGKILIAKRAKKDGLIGKWEFPGGKVEQGETPQEALKRELCEELGIQAIIDEYVGSSDFTLHDAPCELLAFKIYAFEGEIEMLEHSEIRWVKKEELMVYDFPTPNYAIIKQLLMFDHSI